MPFAFLQLLAVARAVAIANAQLIDQRIYKNKWCFRPHRCAKGIDILASEEVTTNSFDEESYRQYSQGIFDCRGTPYLRTKDGRVVPVDSYFELKDGGGGVRGTAINFLTVALSNYMICGHPKNSIPVKCNADEHWYEFVEEDHSIAWPYILEVCTIDLTDDKLPQFNISVPPELGCSWETR
ncbi:unnamed protein product [Ixodes pacificus]